MSPLVPPQNVVVVRLFDGSEEKVPMDAFDCPEIERYLFRDPLNCGRRRYRRTGEMVDGLPVFQEIPCVSQ